MTNDTVRHDSISCGPDYGVDWNFGGQPGWRMTDLEGVRWEDIGPMNERGREVVIKHFHLESRASELPLAAIASMAPESLLGLASGEAVAA